MSEAKKIFNVIFTALEEHFNFDEVVKPKNKSAILELVTEAVEVGSYIEDEEEISYTTRDVSSESIPVEFGTHYSNIKNFISEALESEDPQKVEFTNAIKEVRFKEHEWDFNVSPHCGSVYQKVIEVIHKRMRKSAYYEDPDLTEINDDTFGGMC